MKNILTLFIIILSTIVACAQDTEYADLPAKSSTSGADGFTVMSSGIPYKMTYSVLFSATNAELGVITDSIEAHNLRLLALEGVDHDSTWTSISVDTIQENSGGILIDAAGQIYIDSDNAVNLSLSGANKFISSTENWSLVDMMFSTSTAIKTFTSDASTLSLSAYDVDGAAYLPFITLTAANTPTMTFPQSGGGTTNFLNADGGWTAPAGGGSADSSWVSTGTDTIYIDQARSGTHFTDGDAEELKINISGASTVSITNGNFSIGEDRTLIVSNPISTDSIYEFTPNNGIDIEGIHIQDYSVLLDTMRFNDTNTEIWEDGSSNLSFKDAVTGTKTLAELAASGVVYTFQDGVQESGGVVSLGDTITNDVTITVPDTKAIYFEGFDTDGVASTKFISAEDAVSMWAWPTVDRTGTTNSILYVDEDYAGMFRWDANDEKSVRLNNTQMLVTDAADGKGLENAADYSANATARTHTDSGMVAAMIATLPENAQTNTTYTLVLTDAGDGVTLTNAAAITLTVPPNSSVAFPTGTTIIISQGGAGVVTVAEGAGVTVNSFGSALDLAGIYAYATLRKMDTDEWELFGNIQ